MVPFHIQILTNLTYHIGYKPIFTCQESQHNSHFIATNDSRVLHILEDKSRFTCITGSTDHTPILGTFMHHVLNLGLIMCHA